VVEKQWSRPFVKEANIDTAYKVFYQILSTNLLSKTLPAKLQGLAYWKKK